MGARQYTVRLGLFFFLMFTPFSSFMTILTHIYESAGLASIGPATLATNYTAFIISTFLAPTVRLPIKTQFLLGGCAYTLNYASGIFANMTDTIWLKFVFSCTCTFLAGLTAGPLWVSQGRYIHLACEKEKQASRKGQMYGIFSTIYCLANVSAGLMTTFGLGFFDDQTYFYIITSAGFISVIYCLLFIKNIDPQEVQYPSHKDSLIVPSQGDSRELVFQQIHKSLIQSTQKSPKKTPSLKDVFKYFPVMWMVIPILIVDGFCLGVYSSQIPHLIPDDIVDKDLRNKYAGYLLISLGCGSTLGGFCLSWISDRKSTYFTGRFSICAFFLGCLLYVLAYHSQQYFLSIIAAFQWGFFLFFLEGWMYMVCSKHFQGRPQAFSVNKQLHSIFYLAFQVVLIITSNDIPLLQTVAIFSLMALPSLYLIGKIPSIALAKSRMTQNLR